MTVLGISQVFHHPASHQPLKLLLQLTPIFLGIWCNKDFTTSTQRNHNTQTYIQSRSNSIRIQEFVTCLPTHLQDLQKKKVSSTQQLLLSSSSLPKFFINVHQNTYANIGTPPKMHLTKTQ